MLGELKGGLTVSVIFRPIGGLGNQLFQLGLAKSMAARLGVGVSADLSNWRPSSDRNFELDSFRSGIELISRPTFRTLRSQAVVRFPDPRPLRIRVLKPSFGGVIREVEGENYNFRLLSTKSSAYLHGYFQSWQYLTGVEPDFRSSLGEIVSPSSWFIQQRATLLELGDFISIQVRLGDYVDNPRYGHLTAKYFLDSLRLLTQTFGDLSIVVFSDDVNAARKLLLDQKGVYAKRLRFICPPINSRPIESLNLLSMGKHKIISNSSFGWWGAWLGKIDGGAVYAPNPWVIGQRISSRSFYLPEWTQFPATD